MVFRAKSIIHRSNNRLQKLSSSAAQDWEPKRIQRPAGLPEWGVPPPEPPADSKKS